MKSNTKKSQSSKDFRTGNNVLSLIAYSTRSVAMLSASGPLMQTFLATLGFESGLIYLHSTLLQAFNVMTVIIFSGWTRGESPIKRAAFTFVPNGILFLCYLPLAIRSSGGTDSFIMLAAIGILQQISTGLFTVCDYKLPYYIYRIEDYGIMTAICGIANSVLSFVVGLVISNLSARMPYTRVMIFAFSISAILMGIAFISTIMQRSLRQDDADSEPNKKDTKSTLRELISNPYFTRLIPANFMRGFAAGVTAVLATVALDLGHSEAVTTAMVSAQSCALLIACALFGVTSRKIPTNLVTLIGSITMMLFPLLLIKNSLLFLILFTIIFFGRTLIDYAIPTQLIRIVPVELSGPYNAWRMAMHNGGMLIATTVAAWLPVPILLSLAALFQMISGLAYFQIGKPSKKRSNISNV